MTEHARPQHSEFLPQTSEFAWQEYAGTQKPPWQFVEQQLAAAVHAEPTGLHAPPPTMTAQVVPVQFRVQHSAPAPHATPVSLHWVAEQLPPVQMLVQHSVELRQLVPEDLQKVVWVQMPLAEQNWEQHWLLAPHRSPAT